MESRLDDGSESEITCKQCVVEELKPENVAPCHENTRLFVDSQVRPQFAIN
jgi:hypothetical protein